MQCEILEYKSTTSWNLDDFLNDSHFQSLYYTTWPLIVSTMSVNNGNDVHAMKDFIEGKRRGKPSVLLNSTTNSTCNYIGNKLNMTGAYYHVHAGCAGTLYALHLAAMMSLENQTPVVVFAGDNFKADYNMWMFNSYGAMDQGTGLPFDKSSKGFKMGDGMSMFIVKHPSVESRLDIKAVVKSFYFYTKPNLLTHPGDADDIANHFSKINYKEIELWNAHATGTPVGDIVEYNFFAKTCKQDIPIVGYKGYIGHCMSAAGGMEIAMMLDCKKDNVLKPNLILGEKIVNDDRIITESTSFTYKKILKTSLAFGGKTVVSEIDLY